MREISYIVQNATSSSLIIVDELGRGDIIYTDLRSSRFVKSSGF